MIEHVAVKMKKTVISKIKNNGSLLSITVDESSAFGISYLVIYIRADVTGRGDMENIFLDLVELDEGTTAENVYKALKNSLMMAKLDDEYLKNHLISIATDGAAVMTGKDSGLIASSYSTVKAVWKDFPALAQQMRAASEDRTYTDAERKKYTGMLNRLTSTGFVTDLAIMRDVLQELKSLSLKLQKSSTSLTDASRDIRLTMEILDAMKTQGGMSMREAKASLMEGTFKGVALKESTEKVNQLQFFQAVIDNLSSRLPDSELTKLLKPLDPHIWPKTRDELILYGEDEIYELAKDLGEPAREAVEDFRSWKLQKDQSGKALRRLIVASQTYLATSAECERGFSAMNNTASKTKNRLRVRSLSAVLFVDINAPPLEMFDPKPFVMSWLKEGHCPSTAKKAAKEAKNKREDRPLWSIMC
ncbi:E3 SUMO-protein ligase KIAA1586-like [Esox lucius]|uniref:E3 SUMO-protein ligase KIAA1586-like n=1 Tax=Esox lucius TaxID=8010 RepID=UPI0014768CC0|nr:E3 SUMO-protein ligase KIAA1586-like [Esox lucius]